jgi:hypothetical protein
MNSIRDPNELIEPIAKLVCKIMKLSSHLCELILPKEYFTKQIHYVTIVT